MWADDIGLSVWTLNAVTYVLIRGGRGGFDPDKAEGGVISEAGIGVLGQIK